ncbi:MAG: hypothetical protein ACMVY4_04205 [Minwuia sp.]
MSSNVARWVSASARLDHSSARSTIGTGSSRQLALSPECSSV